MADQKVSRRDFVHVGALVAAGAALGRPPFERAASDVTAGIAGATARGKAAISAGSIRLGLASYSLRKFPRAAAISMVKSLGTPWVNFKSVHLPYEATPAELAAARAEIAAAGLQVVGGGTITFGKDTDEDVRQYFEYAKG